MTEPLVYMYIWWAAAARSAGAKVCQKNTAGFIKAVRHIDVWRPITVDLRSPTNRFHCVITRVILEWPNVLQYTMYRNAETSKVINGKPKYWSDSRKKRALDPNPMWRRAAGSMFQRRLPATGNTWSSTVESRVAYVTSCKDDDWRQVESVRRRDQGIPPDEYRPDIWILYVVSVIGFALDLKHALSKHWILGILLGTYIMFGHHFS